MGKKRSKSKILKNIAIRLGLVGVLAGGYYLYRHPELITTLRGGQAEVLTQVPTQVVPASDLQQSVSDVLGQTTNLIEEGLQTIKVPKSLSGTHEEIILEDVVNQFTNKVSDLPKDQIDRLKIQFCQDLLAPVSNASVVVTP